MNTLPRLLDALEAAQGAVLNEVEVAPDLAAKAMIPLQRMLDFAADNQLKVRGKA
jgi:quinolinate synthase